MVKKREERKAKEGKSRKKEEMERKKKGWGDKRGGKGHLHQPEGSTSKRALPSSI